jgi:hypothetical protein
MRSLIVAAIAAALFAAGPVRAQTAATSIASENLAAARDLLRAMKAADQYKAMVPTLLANLKPTIVQNRREVEKQYDAMMPALQQHEMQRVDELTEAVAAIYARYFTVDELHDIAAFYGTATGQKLIEVSPTISAQNVEAVRQFAREVADDVKKQMGEQLETAKPPNEQN